MVQLYSAAPMDRVVVIANPVASQFTGGTHRDVMAALARTHDVEAIWPSNAAEASQMAAEAADQEAAVVVAMGGDGMVHHVSQGLIGRETSLAIIPVGTTNVVARLAGIPGRASKAVKLIDRSAGATSIGVARLRLRRGTVETTHHAVFAAGFGLDAEVVVEADRDPYRKYRFGSIHYASAALRIGLGRFPSRKAHMRVTSGDRTMDAATTLIQFRELYTYFGKLPLRFSEETPSPMTALVLERLRRRRVPRIVFGAIGRLGLDAVDGIAVWPLVAHLDIVAEPPVAAQADGESLGMVDGAEVDWVPDALRLITAS